MGSSSSSNATTSNTTATDNSQVGADNGSIAVGGSGDVGDINVESLDAEALEVVGKILEGGGGQLQRGLETVAEVAQGSNRDAADLAREALLAAGSETSDARDSAERVNRDSLDFGRDALDEVGRSNRDSLDFADRVNVDSLDFASDTSLGAYELAKHMADKSHTASLENVSLARSIGEGALSEVAQNKKDPESQTIEKVALYAGGALVAVSAVYLLTRK